MAQNWIRPLPSHAVLVTPITRQLLIFDIAGYDGEIEYPSGTRRASTWSLIVREEI